jgi:hypothetical protein
LHVQFSGRDRLQVKRKALDYWYQNRGILNLSLQDFLAYCEMSSDQRTITFRPPAAVVAARSARR